MIVYTSVITQWSIWTIRNICEDHPLNQSVLLKLEKSGTDIEKNLRCSEVQIDESLKLKMKQTTL